MRWRWAIYGLGGWLAGLGLMPLMAMVVAAFIAWAGGCDVTVDRPRPCVIAGMDVGSFLGMAGLMGWYFMLSWPLVVVGGAMIAARGAFDLGRWLIRRR